MTRFNTFIVMVALFSISLSAAAQSAGRRPVRRSSGVTGVELGLDGALAAPRGGQLRWLVTAYEVLGLQNLRPAPGATVTLTTALDPTAATEVTADEYGRAVMELAVPDDAPSSFRAVISLRSTSDVQRRFELTVNVSEPRTLQIWVAREQVQPRGRIHVFGRLHDQTTGRPLRNEEVRLHLRDAQRRQLGAPVTVRTDDSGLFARVFRVPRDIEQLVSIRAEAGDDERPLHGEVAVRLAEPQAPPLLLSIAPSRTLVRSSQRVPVDVVLRTPSGRPVEGAQVLLQGAHRDQAGREAVTDERGRARLEWLAPRVTSGYVDRRISVVATREGYGQASATTAVRVALTDWGAALSVEGGALVPSLGGRVWVRVTSIDGQPAEQGVPVSIEGPRLQGGALNGVTDSDGVVMFDVSLRDLPASTTDRCGGEGASAIRVTAGPAGSGRFVLDACLPLDPDGSARVRATPPLITSGQGLTVEVERTAAARNLPVALTAMIRRGGRMEAVASQVIPARGSTVEMQLPPDVVGRVILRARPLHGAVRQDVRGGTTAIWVVPAEPLGARLDFQPAEDRARLTLGERAQGPHSAYFVALPIDEARTLAGRLRQVSMGPFADLRRQPEVVGVSLLTAALAATVSRDTGAPAVLRDGEGLVAVPAPEDPVSLGLLRDPWRSRARFVTGRLALIFQAIEQQVAGALPERMDDVAVHTNRGWEFNSEIVEAVATSGSLGSGGATGLGGEPLTIEALQQLDRAFTYDNVARRITRERLFRLVLALREFIRRNGFDLPWTRRGDPTTWIRGLVGMSVPGSGSLRREDLVDGWGEPFELRRGVGGRNRFSQVAPLGGWEIVSGGPDRRFGSGDDMWDPTARVLPEGSAYSRAVGEDVLVARLRGVELGRATIEMLRGAASDYRTSVRGVPSAPEAASERLARDLWTRLPQLIEPDPDALALRRPAHPGDGALGSIVSVGDGGANVTLGLDEEPRTWGLVAFAWSPAGASTVNMATGIGGAPLIVEGQLPRRLHTREPVSVDLELTNVTQGPLEVTSRFDIEGELRAEGPGTLRIPAGAAARFQLDLEAREAGVGTLELNLVDPQGARLRQLSFSIEADEGARPVRIRAGGALAGNRWRTRIPVPTDAIRPVGRVVVLTPRALASDPDLTDVRRRDPALLAWSETMSGHALDPELRARLLQAQDPSGVVQGAAPALSTACAIIAWSAAGPDDEDAVAALTKARNAMPRTGPMRDDDGAAGELRAASSVLAALAAGGVSEIADGREIAMDPVARLAAQLRPALRRTIHVFPEEPSLLARAAAALLLADPRDGHGRAMLDRAASAIEELPGGAALVVPSENRDHEVEALTASLALAVAAHQAGREELAERLLRGAFTGENIATRTGGELTFWLLAAGAYGVMGAGEPELVTVNVAGRSHRLNLSEGHAAVVFQGHAGRSYPVSVERIGGPALLARAEVVMGRSFTDGGTGPLELELAGDAGRAGEVAALELTVHAREGVLAPLVDLQLPAGVDASDTLLEVVERSPGVRRVEPRRPGFLRIWLETLAEGTQTVIPLPIRWTAHGRIRGLGAMAYPQGRPQAMTTLAPAELDID